VYIFIYEIAPLDSQKITKYNRVDLKWISREKEWWGFGRLRRRLRRGVWWRMIKGDII
jgi:hypothetical protein